MQRRKPTHPSRRGEDQNPLPQRERPGGRAPAILLAALSAAVGLAIVATHWPVLRARAITSDDQKYITDNHLVRHPSWASAGQFFREVLKPSTVPGYYHPLPMISLMLDWALGARADELEPFHRTSLILHAANVVLVFVWLERLFGHAWIAAVLALLFGVHPLTVEPVAWLSERKTVLATCFALLCLLLYVSWVQRQRLWLYTVALACFVLALLSKPTSTPLPILLLVLDYWPLRRLGWRAVREKVPFLLVALLSAVVTVISQARSASVTMPHEYQPLRLLLTVCHNIIFYVYKLVWPTDLSPHYPVPEPLSLSQPAVLAGAVGTAVLVVVLVVSLRRTRAVAAGWLFFLAALFPTIGIIGFTYTIVADRHVYLPALGLLLILAAFFAWAWDRPGAAPGRLAHRAALLGGTAMLALLAANGTRAQLRHWRTTEGLCRHMLTINPRSAQVHNDLGNELTDQGRLPEAIEHFRLALEANPNSSMAHNNLGVALAELGRIEEAIPHFQEALRLNPRYASACNSLGAARVRQGQLAEALRCFRQALELDRYNAEIHCNLGGALALRGELPEAIAPLREAVRLRPEFAGAHVNLGIVLGQLGQLEEAAGHFREAIRLRPWHANTYEHLAQLYVTQGKLDEAVRVYEAGLRMAPDDAALRAGLQEVLAQQRAEASPP